jgi:hypothetical protein
MKNIKNENPANNSYFLYNVTNYKLNIDNSVQEILKKFVSITIEYLNFISEKITMKNKMYYKFILERGLETLIHIFSLIFYYTKNLDLTFYHTQKAYYFYLEFIEQISDENVTFLQLTSRDAILFVYKKTIYDINNEYIKNIIEPTPVEHNILLAVDTYILIYKKIIMFFIHHPDFKYDTKTEYIHQCCKHLETISESIYKSKIKNSTELIDLLINSISNKEITIDTFFCLVIEFIKKINGKKKIDENIIKQRIYNINNDNVNDLFQLKDCTNCKEITNYIFAD